MKTLPDSPSLDHLRQQAKDVLTNLRMVRPEATLSDAQTLVAEQHGFRTWPDLKAEVDRRSAEVRTADDGVARAVADAFGIGPPQGAMTAVERQWAGQAWSLTTDRGRWLARQLFQWFDESAVDSEVLLAEAAAFRVAGPDDLVVLSWEHAGAIPPRWDLGHTLATWSSGVLDQVNAPAARALVGGYAEESRVPPLDLGVFSTMVCTSLNWLGSRIQIALRGCDAERREFAARAAPTLLADPPSRATFQAILDAL